MTKTIKLDTTFQGWVRRLCFALVFVFGQYALSAQTTATFTCTGTAGSFKSGSVNAGGTKNDGNMVTINSSANRGWATYDISSIPGGSTIVSANLLFTTYSSTSSSAVNNCYGFIGDPATLSGTALYTACASGTTWNATSWTANALQTKAVSAAGITFIGANLGGNINVGYVRGSTNTYNIYGYSGVTPPQLQITYISSTPCAGQPTPGNTVSSTASACPTVPFTLSLQNPVGGSGITYQWESADDAGFTVNATNLGTGSTQSASQTSAKYYRCLVTCTNSGLSDYSVPVLVNVSSFLSCYCIPTTTNGCVSGDHITNVTFTSNANPINNSTGACLTASYSNYTAIQASVTQGDMVSVSVSVNNGGTEYAAGWIDFDQSGTFDAGEFIALTDADGIAPWVYTGTVTIPLTATVGITGMRFRSSFAAAITAGSACATYSYGETEDYRLDIAQTFACSGQPTPGNTTGPSNICPNISFTLGLQNPPTSTGITFQWESADDAGFSVNVTSLGTAITQSVSQTSDKYYRCLVTCTNSGLSDYSAALNVTTNNFLACYCPANSSFGSSGNFYGIVDNVTFDAINQTSGFPATPPYYTDYPTPTAQITQGVPTPISVSVGQYTQVGVWIDFDQSGTFDASEFTFLGNNANTPGVVYNGTINVPITATTGLTKMRVRSEAYFYANLVGTQACGLTNYGETEDYSININPSVACSGQPVPGNTVANVSSVCPNGTVNLSLQNIATLGTGVTFQWERADDAGFSNNVVALGTNSTESTVQTTASYYRCNVTCSNSGLSDYSVTAFVSMNAAYNCTCASAPTQAADEEIYNVTIGSGSTDPLYANANGCSTPAPGPGSSLGRYSNFKTLPPIATIEAGATTSFTVEENECDGATYYAFGTGIWADLNQDGDFDDAGEELFKETATATGPRNITGTFMIPVTATVGLTALRIIAAESYAGATLTPCLAYGYGETEDFLIDITPATGCGGVPAPGNTLASVSAACPNQPFTLSFQNSNLGGGITYQWESADDAAFTVNVTALGTGLTEVATQTSDKYYRCVVTCTNSGLSDFSTPIFMATNTFLSCYCPASSSFGSSGNFYGLLTNVSLDIINNTTAFPAVAPYYTDYPTPTAQITQGVLAPISITVGQYTQAGVWVDYDQSGTFDASEFTFIGNNTNTPGVTYNTTLNVPLTATVGLTKMRVRTEAYFYANLVGTQACGNTNYGETEDYLVNINAIVACSGTPTPGNTLASAASVCPNGTVNLSMQNAATLGTGVTYQWESADDAGFTVNVVALGTNVIQSDVLTSAKYYRCLVTCTNSGLSDYSVPVLVSMSSFIDCYCTSAPSNAFDEEIYSVTLDAGTTNPLYAGANGCVTAAPGAGSILGRYSNFKTLAPLATLTQGATSTFTVEENECDGATFYAFGTGIWIDFNHDGDFTDLDEAVFIEGATSVGPRNVTGTFLVPATALTGNTVMRVIVAEGISGAALNPCLAYGYGETEDHLIDIQAGNPCSGAPTPGNTIASASTYCSPATITLSMTSPNQGAGVTYQWEQADDAAFTVNVVSLGTNAIETVTLTGGNFYYRCNVTCTNSGLNTYTVPVYVSQNAPTLCYCPVTNAGSSCISNITMGTLNNTTAGCSGGTNYSQQPGTTNLTQGTTENFTITEDGGSIISVWIDFDQSGTFDASEHTQVALNSVSPTTVGIAIPGTATLGVTGMRVRTRLTGNQNGPNDACIAMGSGETEDYQVTIIAATGCSGAPTPGATAASASTTCAGSTVTLSLPSLPSAAGYTYQWEQADDAAFTTNVVALGTGATETVTVTGNFYYRCAVTCTNSSITTTSIEVGVTVNTDPCACPAVPYCVPTTTNACDEYIDNVTFAGINNNSGCGSPYQDFTTVSGGAVTAGSSYTLTYNCPVFYPGVGGDEVNVYFDWNHDGDFSDPDETYTTDNLAAGTGTIAVPATATAGPTRMRVRMMYTFTTPLDPCATGDWSEAEDYCVTVSPVSTATLPLKFFIEGFYYNPSYSVNAVPGEMEPVLMNGGFANPATECDNVTIDLCDITTYSPLYSFNGVVNTNGTISATFPGAAIGGTYYVAVKSRTAIRTWYYQSITLAASNPLIDFSVSSSEAAGGNQVEVEPGVWGFFTGDINQDAAIDGFDYIDFDPDLISATPGYIPEDLTGDAFGVDLFDYLLLDPNVTAGITEITP